MKTKIFTMLIDLFADKSNSAEKELLNSVNDRRPIIESLHNTVPDSGNFAEEIISSEASTMNMIEQDHPSHIIYPQLFNQSFIGFF